MMTNRTLAYAFFGLLVLYAAVVLWPGRNDRDRSFRETLVAVDTAAITTVTIHPRTAPDETLRFTRDGAGWRITDRDRSADTDANIVRRAFAQLERIETRRLAATRPERWAEFGTSDSLGTRVIIETADGTAADLVFGRLNFDPDNPRDATTYMRVTGEDEVYVAPGFLAMGFDRPFQTWRNRTVLKAESDALTRITVETPDDVFTLDRTDTGWTLDGQPTDSLETARYVSALQHVSATKIVDDPGALPDTPHFTATFADSGSTIATVFAYARPGENAYLLGSSQNPGTLFSVPDTVGVFPRLFIDRERLLP